MNHLFTNLTSITIRSQCRVQGNYKRYAETVKNQVRNHIIFDKKAKVTVGMEATMKQILIESLPVSIILQINRKQWSSRKIFQFVSDLSEEAQRRNFEVVRTELDVIAPTNLSDTKSFIGRFNNVCKVESVESSTVGLQM